MPETIIADQLAAELAHPMYERVLRSHTYSWLGYESSAPEHGAEIGWSNVRPPTHGYARLYVIEGTSWGDYVGSVIDRANYAELMERYPEFFIVIGDIRRGMALAMAGDWTLPGGLADDIRRLASGAAILDEDLEGSLIDEIACEGWDNYGEWDFSREVAEYLGFEVERDDWRDVWAAACWETEYYPEPESATSVILWNRAVVIAAAGIVAGADTE